MSSPIGPVRFSTTGSRDPARELRALNERHVVLPLEPLPGAPVRADLARWAYPDLGILSGTLAGLRHGANAGPGRAGHDDHLYFGITLAGRSVASQRGREATLEDGDGVLLSAADGFTMTHRGPVRFLGLRLSRAVLRTHLAAVDDGRGVVRRDTPALALLTRYVGIALDEALRSDPGLPGLVADHVYELAALALRATDDAAPHGPGVRAARLRAIQADIVANLDDGALSVGAVAARHGVTPRYVHKLFEPAGVTFSAFVLGRRLERAHRMLADPRYAGRSISALALCAGFGDLSYFNRTFRRRYGATPSDVRRSRR